MRLTYLTPGDLPPRPDPMTGLPRPPHAPSYRGAKAGDDDPDREVDGTQIQHAPPGQGPVLAAYRSSRHGALKGAGWLLLVAAVVATIHTGGSLRWVAYWQVWLFVAPLLAGMYFSVRAGGCAAGADWLAKPKGSWVQTYELVKVTGHSYSNDLNLKMTDSHGRELEISVTSLQADRYIWDLVYNGILHSVIAGGAETNGMLHMSLKLPYPTPDQEPPKR